MPANVNPFRSASTSLVTRRDWLALGLALGPVLTLGCASAGQFTWYSDLPAQERSDAASDYVIGVGDSISIRVYEQEPLSGEAKIRSDGKIALPLIGELLVAGRKPLELSKEIEKRLKEFVVSPRVTVNVTASYPVTVTVLGEAKTIGTLTLEPPPRLVDALAKSGGLSEYANDTRIFVLRQFPAYRRIRFKWDDILRNEGGAAQFPLRTGDVIVIE
jgi:polysaccharide export outer membrane protein